MATTGEVAAWRRVIAAQERGDETQGQFCERRGLKLETFRNWKSRLARGEGASAKTEAISFLPVKMVERAVDTPSGIELALAGGHVVHVARGFDAETLRRLVEALESRSC